MYDGRIVTMEVQEAFSYVCDLDSRYQSTSKDTISVDLQASHDRLQGSALNIRLHLHVHTTRIPRRQLFDNFHFRWQNQ